MNAGDVSIPADNFASELWARVQYWAQHLGFLGVAVSLPVVSPEKIARAADFVAQNHHGEMSFLAKNTDIRANPKLLHEATQVILSFQLPYLQQDARAARAALHDPNRAYISRYALGRDYHKVMRQKLKQFCEHLAAEFGEFSHRICVDSAPIFEVEFAQQSGLGWEGKHTLLLNRVAGSMFFLGEVLADLPLKPTEPIGAHCGRCSRCMDVCPTGAIIAPHQLDARLCISYLTIEYRGVIPEHLREKIGNRIYGCDDCQLFCPWNRFARLSAEPDFAVRHGLDTASLLDLLAWSEQDFLNKMAGSAIYRIGFEAWQRNIVIALGNAPKSRQIAAILHEKRSQVSDLVREHLDWALARHAF